MRAPDNVLYLTNFWGMKGFEAVVFPRQGEPTLVTLDGIGRRTRTAQRGRAMFGTSPATRPADPRPRVARALESAAEVAREHGPVGLELSLGTQATDRMVGEPTTYSKGWFDAIPGGADSTGLLAEARMR